MKTVMIKQKYKAHPIGQGFFYSGQLKGMKSRAEFNFVFDCGSLSYSVLNDTIDRFRNKDSNSTEGLDLLVISHFDADHINGLKRLLNGRKVKRIVAPFIGFKQRISIALNFINGFEEDDDTDDLDNSLNSIIDITTVLSDNIDEQSEFIFINGTDETPPNEEGYENIEKLNENINEFSFEFNNENNLSEDEEKELNLSNVNNGKKVGCDKIASILGGGIKIIDLIFYRKKVGAKDSDFFDKVYEIFIEKNITSFGDKENPTTQEIVDVIKGLRGADMIKNIFKEASVKIDIELSKTEIKNMNTTALSMLHIDRLSNSLIRMDVSNSRRFHLDGEIKLSHVYGDKEIEFPIVRDYYHYHYRFHGVIYSSNTLLTSDSFLKEKKNIDKFITHYQNYLDRIIMFQIPHHGSKNSSSKYLFTQLAPNFSFINYGVSHNFIKRWAHPHNEVINDLVATGHSKNMIPVHEYSGYEIVQAIHIHRI